VRIPAKDQANSCELFKPRLTVAREGVPGSAPPAPLIDPAPRSASDARLAFDRLFKK
jgi:hypothetical protein